ncbi:antizyme inhibitor 1b [Oncorhynchus tshawytscha]|uniref:Orn/DAP/Arg decarboxylase 2 N-terminal domain-containing protein n=1 Tax=Oncorhynchus tshawytscha TaxID=74940 RepID=A0A8C8G7V8_ONCTS|nr:antizyme inhibitor 1b [Oncorhynchus tshawytscha]XP_042165876.1 antizyme inhibitor 1b [Oncorhynchus tshawytscha]XP_042165877.1 antizyme inhibitor 1b [Oncorhynchus tshawytscha]
MKGLADEPNHMIELLEGGTTLEDVIDGHVYEQALAEKSVFVVSDLGSLMRQHVQWQLTMPQIRPYYQVQSNSSPVVIEVLASLGLGFVCADKAEVSLVLDHGVPPDNIIFSGVCKQLSHIKHAAKNGVDLLVCDSETELYKIARSHPKARLLVQVTTWAQAAETSMEFGCSLKSCRHLLEAAKDLGVQVVGVTFHIPSSCKDLQAYTHALSDARCVFDMGAELGFNMSILDIGGGFSGSEFQLKQVHTTVRLLLDAYFPTLSGVQVIAQPGSYYVSSAFTLAVNVIGKKVVARDWNGLAQDELTPDDEPEFLYYLNDGVYGSFSSKLLGSTIPAPAVHKRGSRAEEPVFSSSLWGPSCDSLDQLVDHCLLPELSPGDWLVFNNMGAAGLGDLSSFSDRSAIRPPVYYTVSTADWYNIQEAGIAVDSIMKNFSMVQYGA